LQGRGAGAFAWLLLFAAAFPLRGEIVDRIAVSVGNRVITASDIDREIRVTAFLDGRAPDFSPAGKRATAGRLVEQQLIQRELETSRYTIPSAAEMEPAFEKFKRERFPNQADYERALAAAGLSSQDVKDELLWARRLTWFVNARFRLGVQVTEEEIRDYFEKAVKPAAEAAHPRDPVTLDEYRDKIEETLAGPRVDREVDAWLTEARKRTEIVYHVEAFQ